MLELADVNFGYTKDKSIIKSLNFKVSDGECVMLFGPNGSGKTTLLKLIAGILAPDSGSVSLNTQRIDEIPPKLRAESISYMPQIVKASQSLPLCARDIAAFGYYARSGWFESRPSKRIAAVEKISQELRITHLLDKPIVSLSPGEIKKIHLARIWLQDSPLMLLDEPTAHVDLDTKAQFYEKLKTIYFERKKTLILVVHSKEDIPDFAGRMICLQHGMIVQDGATESVKNTL